MVKFDQDYIKIIAFEWPLNLKKWLLNLTSEVFSKVLRRFLSSALYKVAVKNDVSLRNSKGVIHKLRRKKESRGEGGGKHKYTPK